MNSGSQALDRIARSAEAVFATDPEDRVILWNKKCETILGRPAREVLGKKCYDILGGNDTNDNLYCHQSCPVAFQARERTQTPVNRFILKVEVNGRRRPFWVAMFAIPASHPALAAIVHVLRDAEEESVLEKQLAREAEVRKPLWPILSARESKSLTKREEEILLCMAEGMNTPSIGSKLLISSVTVRNHVSNILHKLDVHTKLAAVAYAYRNRLI